VAEFLSPEWVGAFNAAVAAAEVPEPGPDTALAAQGGQFSVCQIVTGKSGDELATTLVVDAKRVTMVREATDHPDVVVRLGWDDASALARGFLSPIDALAAGRIRVRGDLGVLVAGQALLGSLQELLHDLNAHTTY